MINIQQLRKQTDAVISIGSHPGIIQSILDYDFLIGKKSPSVKFIIANGRRQERYFWGEGEVTIPVLSHLDKIPAVKRELVTVLLNVLSARRVLSSMKVALELLPNIRVVSIFAEQTPESHSLELSKLANDKGVLIVGPSSVGLLVPGFIKLGPIGGTQHEQLSLGGILDIGNTAVISTSGGIVNELIHSVTSSGLGVSFALAVGGDRFPLTTLANAMLLAEKDTQTKTIVLFGELGGTDEYEIADLMNKKKITKKVIVYIAGIVADLFETPPQFGHAKALAGSFDESASAKKAILREAGAIVCNNFADIKAVLEKESTEKLTILDKRIGKRKHSMMVSHISGEEDGTVQLLGRALVDTVNDNSIASLILSLLLGRQVTSEKAVLFIDYIFRLLMDHGPQVSGAVNTIISARAGKELVSSLASGLLTIGPRFGGAINEAAQNWITAVNEQVSARELVESFAIKGEVISGIGHKRYHTDSPDPRVDQLKKFGGNTNGDVYLNFALSVEKITTIKKRNLILNVDGIIAALLLDILESELDVDRNGLQELVNIEFFNALFVTSRSIGFTAHFLDQKRHDEGLFRLPTDDIHYIIDSDT